MIHINHPKELTPETINVLNNFRRIALATVMSQTVLLKGINDCEEVLYELFMKLTEEGIRPYYVYKNDPVPEGNAWEVNYRFYRDFKGKRHLLK